MTIYYRGPCAYITRDLIEVWTPQHAIYPISELHAVYVVHGSQGRRGTAGVLPVLAVLAAVLLPVAGAPTGLLAIVLMLGAAATVTVACLREPPHPYELTATHQGRRVALFQCPDERTFGQVKRALARAMEQHVDR